MNLKKCASGLALGVMLFSNLMMPFTYAASGDEVWTGKSSSFTFTMPDWAVSLFAESEANDYTVKFHGNGHTNGATMSDESMTFDVKKALTENEFEKTGYTFQGWHTNSGATTASYTDKESVENLTTEESGTVDLYAIWKANTYQVQFNLNADSDELNIATGTMANQIFTYDTTGTLTSNAFVRTGYTFQGWATGANLDVAYSDKDEVLNLTTTSGNVVTLYAKWQAKNNIAYKVEHYIQNLDLSGYDLKETDNLSGTTYQEVSPATKNYSGFTAPSKQKEHIKGDGKTVIKYYYTRNSYTLSFNTTGSTVASKSYKFEEPFGELSGSSQSGYDFNGWYSGNIQVTSGTTMPATGLTLTASWTPRDDTKYKVYHLLKDIGTDTYTISGALTQELSGTTSSELVFDELDKTLTGFTYTGGSTTSGSTLPTFESSTTINQYGGTEIYLYYTRNSYTVTLYSGAGITSVPAVKSYEYNEPVTLSAVVDPCYTWANWTGYKTLVGITSGFNMPADNVSLTANATINKYNVTVSAKTGASVSNAGATEYKCGDKVTLSGSALAGYTWAHWNLSGLTDSSSVDAGYSFTMPNNPVIAEAEVTNNTGTAYQVRHERATLTGYYDHITTTSNNNTTVLALSGTTDATIQPDQMTYTGFTKSGEVQTTTIKGDGSTVVTYQYTRNQHTVGLTAGKGIASVSGAGTYLYEQLVSVSAVVKDGYSGATVTWAGTTGASSFNMPDYNVSMTASASPITYSITYNLNGGSLTTTKNSYTIESDDITLDTPTREGYTFAGWTGTALAETSESVTIGSGSTGNRVYDAIWTANDVGITVNYYQQSLTGEYVFVESGHDAGLSDSTVTGSLKTYDGFITPAAQSVTVNPNGSAVINYEYQRARYAVNMQALTGVSNLSYTGSYCTDDGCLYKATVTLSGDLKSGYKNLEWTGYTNQSSFEMPAYAVNISGQASVIPYIISFVMNGGDAIASVSYNVETPTFTLATGHRIGYTFVGWTGEDVTTPTTSVEIPLGSTGNRVYTANWSANKVTVTVTHRRANIYGEYDDSAALNEVKIYETEYDADQENAVVPALTGYGDGFKVPENLTISKVSADGTTTGEIFYPRKQFTVSFSALTGVENLDGSGTYYYEAPVILTGSLKSGYTGFTFTGYTGESSFNMPAKNVTMQAYATPITYHIAYENAGGTFADEVYEYTVETPTFTLATGSKVGYDFKGWTGTDVNEPTVSVIISKGSTGDRSFVANWTSRNDTAYTVYHYIKEIGKNSYTGVVEEHLTGTTDAILTFANMEDSSIPCVTYTGGSLTGSTSGLADADRLLSTTIKPDGSTKVYLYYTRNVKAVNLSGDAHINKLNGADNYECGAEVTVSATTNAGYHFLKWIDKSLNTGTLTGVKSAN